MSETPRRSVRMTDDEAWAFVEAGHTGILTTLRRSGEPIALPVWFATVDRRIYVSTRGKKLVRARNDARASFLVEAGERWAELQAVHLTCRATVHDELDGEIGQRVHEQLDTKYAAYRTSSKAMPKATKEHYRKAAGAVIELVPTGKLLTWDNHHLGLD